MDCTEFDNGKHVTVDVLKLDRASINPRRMPTIIMKIIMDIDKRYHLVTEFGTIGTYHVRELMEYSGIITAKTDKTITLREVARQPSLRK